MATNEQKSKNVIFLALSGIGNLLMQLPAIAAFKKAYPTSRVTVWVAPRGTKAIAEACSYIDAVIEAPIKTSLKQHIALTWKLAREKFTAGVVLSPGQLVKSAGYLFLAGVPARIGNSYPFRGQPSSHFLLTEAVEEQEQLHDIEQNLRLVAPLHVSTDAFWEQPYHLDIPLPHQQQAGTYFQEHHIPQDKALIGIHAGSAPAFMWKRWPLDRFATVAQRLVADGSTHILLFGGPEEQAQNEELKRLINHPAVTIVSAPLLTTAAMMQSLTYLISNDSGLMHLAAASGVKVFGLFGPTDEKKTGPRGIGSVVIRAAGTQPVYHTEKNFHVSSDVHESMLAITPELVLETINGTN